MNHQQIQKKTLGNIKQFIQMMQDRPDSRYHMTWLMAQIGNQLEHYRQHIIGETKAESSKKERLYRQTLFGVAGAIEKGVNPHSLAKEIRDSLKIVK